MSGALNSVVGGGNGGLLGAIGGLVGNSFAGPLGAMVGQAVGNLLQQGLCDGTKQAIDTLQKEQGMPKFLADDAKSKIDSTVAGLLNKSVTPEAQEQAQALTGDVMKSFVDDVSKNIVDSVTKDLKESGESGGSGKASADSWMVAIAKAMGKMMGQRAEKLVGLSKAMSETQTGTDTASQQASAKEMQVNNANFQATSQEFSLLQNTFSTAIKSIGEAMSSVARKQ